jgi:hypothetical protein
MRLRARSACSVPLQIGKYRTISLPPPSCGTSTSTGRAEALAVPFFERIGELAR